MLRLTERLRRDVYTPLYYVYAGSDKTSAARIEAAGHPLRPQEEFRIQRSREVKQSWVTTWGTASVACLHAVVLVFRLRPDLVLANGPGTCLPICYAVFLMRVLGWHRSAKVIFCESFCRVQTLSLTGKLVYPIADRFVVHWPELLKGRSRAEYIGQLC